MAVVPDWQKQLEPNTVSSVPATAMAVVPDVYMYTFGNRLL